MTNFKSKLEQTRNDLQELGNTLSNLVNSSTDIFETPEINSRLNEFRQAYQEAMQRLEKPSFCIATIGTTSSGKSTIVNALIGRRIAPIEAGEMSGGVLTLKHSEERKLIISTTEEGIWEAGEWFGLNDDELYDRIRSLMHRYHEHRRKKNCIAPDVTAFVPILPVCNPNLLSLPSGVGVEFIDLPGVKSVLDRTNLSIIQQRVNKAFSLVALDYMQVDDEQRKRLLEELQQVVKYLAGRTDSMIFILNRVDQQGADDLPISERLAKLQQEIQEVLSLQNPPDILPFNARLLYYAQCAWGAGALNEVSKVDGHTRLQILKAMFQDCAGVIKVNVTGNRDLKQWFRDLEDRVDENKLVDDGDMQQILSCALQWSGGEKLWELVRRRVQESFSELVLLPIIIDVFQNYDALENAFNIILQARKIYNPNEIQKEREKIASIRKSLQDNTRKICHDFQDEIKQYINALKSKDVNLRNQVIQEAVKKGRKGFQVIFDTVDDVEGDLTQLLIAPTRDAFKNNQSAYELEEKLEGVISPPLAKDVARGYDNVSRRLKNFVCRSGCLVRRVRENDKTGMRELENDERCVRLLYHTVREALSARAEFSLQAKAKEFVTALELLINDQLTRLRYSLPEKEFSALDIEQAVISDLRKKLSQNLPDLPDKFFEIPTDYIQQEEIEEIGKVGIQKVTRSRETGSCLNKKTEYYDDWQDKMGQVKYKELSLPDVDTMAKQWLGGIEKGKESLWTILSDWIINRSNEVITMFERSVKEIINLAERSLQEQLNVLEQMEEEIQHWNNFEIKKNAVTIARQKLEEVCKSNISQII